MAKAQKNRASKNPYISPSQLSLVGFEYNTPQNSDHWLSLVKIVTLSVDYESKTKKIYSGI